MNQFDIIAIGDITTDAFIRLKDAAVNCDINTENCTLCMRFGDKIPFDFDKIVPAVGNSPNAAVSAARLGLSSTLMAQIGDDRNGEECLATLAKENVNTNFVVKHPGKKTNYHYVLWYEDERTILIKHELFDYKLPDLDSPKWIYLSSLGESAGALHDQLAVYLETHPEISLSFQPGTFQMKLGTEKLAKLYAKVNIFFCNLEEAKRILNSTETDIKKLLDGLRALGPKIAIITDGPKGAYASDGTEYLFMPPYPDPKPPYERTGAGDAFSSTITAALCLGLPLKEALRWGPINSMSVVQKIGAQEGLLSRADLEKYLAEAPSDFHSRPL
jgi:sugar/nucleoside kinase (ribokinase family)